MVEMALPRTNIGSLPPAHLTATTLLGAGGDERETVGQLYAAQIANFLSLKNPDEKRTLVLGLGLRRIDADREAFFDVLELVQKVI
jgi:proteasome assembly chaperone 3